MSAFIIDVPMPSMGATVSELTVINLAVAAGAKVTKGQKLAELESDKSAFDFESPADGTILEVKGKAGDVKKSGDLGGKRQGARLDPARDQARAGGGARSGRGHGHRRDGSGRTRFGR